ncbi:MAG: 50S ribosomal protein L29 [Bacteroidales bacterium]|nr:50S ribosomal protein L29 [Bacteroidales bacterium]
MKKLEIKEYTTKELREKLKEEKLKLTKLRINHAVSPLENPMLIRNTRKNIARILTELRKRELKNVEQVKPKQNGKN